jgi:hypothetical protein
MPQIMHRSHVEYGLNRSTLTRFSSSGVQARGVLLFFVSAMCRSFWAT